MRDKIIDLTDDGVFEFVYTDKHNVILFFKREEDNQLYRVTTDKNYEVEAIDLIETPKTFNGYSELKFFKPYPVNVGGHVYAGYFKKGDQYYKFNIENETMKVQSGFEYEDKSEISDLVSMEEFTVTSSIRKRDRVFFVGKDKQYGDALYGIVNTNKDIIERVYYLYSDEGDFVPKTVTVDVTEQQVHIAGYQAIEDRKVPYFETFILPRN